MATVSSSEPDGDTVISGWVPDGIDLNRLAHDPFARRARIRRIARVVGRHLLDGLILCGWNAIGADAAIAMYLSRTSAHETPPGDRPPWT